MAPPPSRDITARVDLKLTPLLARREDPNPLNGAPEKGMTVDVI